MEKPLGLLADDDPNSVAAAALPFRQLGREGVATHLIARVAQCASLR
ncbi:MAG: hypothetical protein K0U79_13125 [Gammaproteobacteria bacterium]|nr:hypothetical protein [Gammaproteobacteria bacterium]